MSRRRRSKRRGQSRSPRARKRAAQVLFAGGLVGAALLGGRFAMGTPSTDAPAAPPRDEWMDERVRVEVINAGGVSGMAGEATSALREAGFDVVDFGNARAFDSTRPSQVVDRVGRANIARAVAEELGIGNVLSEPNPNLYVDVTVVLGQDWNGLAGTAPAEGPGPRSWWDPRRWFARQRT